jgi:hypothetical protein
MVTLLACMTTRSLSWPAKLLDPADTTPPSCLPDLAASDDFAQGDIAAQGAMPAAIAIADGESLLLPNGGTLVATAEIRIDGLLAVGATASGPADLVLEAPRVVISGIVSLASAPGGSEADGGGLEVRAEQFVLAPSGCIATGNGGAPFDLIEWCPGMRTAAPSMRIEGVDGASGGDVTVLAEHVALFGSLQLGHGGNGQSVFALGNPYPGTLTVDAVAGGGGASGIVALPRTATSTDIGARLLGLAALSGDGGGGGSGGDGGDGYLVGFGGAYGHGANAAGPDGKGGPGAFSLFGDDGVDGKGINNPGATGIRGYTGTDGERYGTNPTDDCT